ncbi:thiamine-phosphate kinase [Vibrio sp. S11_S32]|uniref:thiamine-phosphate kinase n=1 Tax=Vibrio sp. S11_S32 TaxID=2720225 RepID=UPI001681B3C4|nr:thiamine-phosphate kinase [Vibrio sp. S11_S32]MBD1575109.1 thiamine-phosphate kinase [Vibrio sp. S11_S32]
MSGEFNLIDRYFSHRQENRSDVQLALGDDCALLTVPTGYQLAVSTDTVVLGVHFLADANPADIAYKALMSNISDLAAMGATPAWLSMAISMPQFAQEVENNATLGTDDWFTENWLEAFCDSMFTLANQHNLQLIGGDTTNGPLTITFTIQGFVPSGQAMTRSGAKLGDWLYVSGNLGDSLAGLEVILDPSKSNRPHAQYLVQQHFRAQSRINFSQSLRGLASSCIDISDGLTSDLLHILKRSNVSARLNIDALPVSIQSCDFYGSMAQAQQAALTSGEEYELCFTVPDQYKTEVDKLEATSNENFAKAYCIGRIIAHPELTQQPEIQLYLDDKLLNSNNSSKLLTGFDHFKS